MFECDKCGCCCRNVDKNEIYASLDRGDGTCKYLVGNLCSIYETRPIMCRVDEAYDRFFKNTWSREVYYQINKDACEKLKLQEEQMRQK